MLRKFHVTGSKAGQKLYHSHSDIRAGLKTVSMDKLMETYPEG